MAALQAVTAGDPGAVVNDFYSVEDYIRRRAGWLGKLPVYKHISALFPIARYDAALVFAAVHTPLSVQEVRRREEACGIDPLLPLPTTKNCLTIDDFASYPQDEWSPSVGWPVNRDSVRDDSTSGLSTPSAPIATSSMSNVAPRSSRPSQGLSDETGSSFSRISSIQNAPTPITLPARNPRPFRPLIDLTSRLQTKNRERVHVPRAVARSSAGPMTQTVNGNQGVASFMQTPRKSTISSHNRSDFSSSTGLPTISGSGPPSSTSSAPTTPMFAGSPLEVSGQQQRHRPALENVQGLRKPAIHLRPAATLYLKDNEGVASFSNRGVSKPVKRRHMHAEAEGEAHESTSTFEAASQPVQPMDDIAPPKKRQRRQGKPVDEQDLQSKEDVRTPVKLKLKAPHRPPSSPSDPSRASARTKNAGSNKLSSHFEAVVSGNALPKTINEAKRASTDRQQRLLEQHPSKQRASKSARRASLARTSKAPDLMPEFFNPVNFEPGMEYDSVRCVCGVIFDDGEATIACDECNVWQHMKCVGDAVPSNPADEEAEYLCQMCDPWAHRKLIAELRRKQPLQ